MEKPCRKTRREPAYPSRLTFIFAGLLLSLFLLFAGAGLGEERNGQIGAARYLESIRNDPVRLEAFVRGMPKGGDIHAHLSGVPDAESYLDWAAEDGMCINTTNWTISRTNFCWFQSQPVADILNDITLYNQAIDGLSMRNFPLEPPRYGHDHFFSVFSRLGAVSSAHKGKLLAEAANKAAADNTDYLELMTTLQRPSLQAISETAPWTDDLEKNYYCLLGGVHRLLRDGQAELDAMILQQREILACDGRAPPRACDVSLRFIQQGNRNASSQRVFASLIFGAEMAARDHRVVGVDLVSPEDHPAALANYSLHMEMLAFLRTKYPSLRIALHAGELSPNIASPPDLAHHITDAVRIAGAHRIGHGVSLKYEINRQELVAEMARRGVGVAILLTGNAQILGIKGSDHPFPLYLRMGVPVMLATDNQGISRSSHSREFLFALSTYNLNWDQLKNLARNSLEHSFLSGQGLWKTRGDYSHMADACANDKPGRELLSKTCDIHLRTNDKAREQWRLEGRLCAFERQFEISIPP